MSDENCPRGHPPPLLSVQRLWCHHPRYWPTWHRTQDTGLNSFPVPSASHNTVISLQYSQLSFVLLVECKIRLSKIECHSAKISHEIPSKPLGGEAGVGIGFRGLRVRGVMRFGWSRTSVVMRIRWWRTSVRRLISCGGRFRCGSWTVLSNSTAAFVSLRWSSAASGTRGTSASRWQRALPSAPSPSSNPPWLSAKKAYDV